MTSIMNSKAECLIALDLVYVDTPRFGQESDDICSYIWSTYHVCYKLTRDYLVINGIPNLRVTTLDVVVRNK